MQQYLRLAERLLIELLSIPGASTREAKVLEYIAAKLRAAGAPAGSIRSDLAHRHSPYGGEAGNLVLCLPGAPRTGRRMLVAHVDTVPLCRGGKPRRKGRLLLPPARDCGLGADDRAGTAVLLAAALRRLREPSGEYPPVTFLWTVQEELGLLGARWAQKSLWGRPQMAFNFDSGSAAQVTVGATGGYRMKITVHGIASHAGASPEQGVSALTIAALAIARLHGQGWLGRVEKGARTGTSNLGVICGGEATNIVMPRLELRAEARSHQPAFRRQIVRAIQRAFRQAAQQLRSATGRTGRVRFEGRLDYEAFKLPDDEPCVLAAEAAVRAAGGCPMRHISRGGLDANWLVARGVPAVTIGCGQQHPHTTCEQLDLAEFRRACAVAWHLVSAGR